MNKDKFKVVILLILALVCLSGCASFGSFIQTLEAHDVESCIRYEGFVGGGLGATTMVEISGVTGTGGVSVLQCMGYEKPSIGEAAVYDAL